MIVGLELRSLVLLSESEGVDVAQDDDGDGAEEKGVSPDLPAWYNKRIVNK